MAAQQTEIPTAGIKQTPMAAGLGAELRYYKAFISYSHNDEKFAQKLHRRLERYRLPKSLRSGGKSVGAIFRDKAELSVSSGLDKSIKAALDASDHLNRWPLTLGQMATAGDWGRLSLFRVCKAWG